MDVSIELIKELRAATGAGISDCKKALLETECNLDAAIEYLRKKGAAKAAKKADRSTKEGIVFSYIHHNEKVGVLLELACETDFVARTEDFHALAKKISLQIAAMSPLYVSREDVPEDVIAKEKEIAVEKMKDSGKPANVIEKIVENMVEKYFEENCLYEQVHFEEQRKIQDMITDLIAKVGENIRVARFARFGINQ